MYRKEQVLLCQFHISLQTIIQFPAPCLFWRVCYCHHRNSKCYYYGVVNPQLHLLVPLHTTGTNPTCTGNSLYINRYPYQWWCSPTYQWKSGATNIGNRCYVFEFIIFDGSSITCVMTSNASCVSQQPPLSTLLS